MRVLMLMPHLSVRGPIARHSTHLVRALRRRGFAIAVLGWGRHQDDQRMVTRMVSRLTDVWRVAHEARRLRPDVLFVKTAHGWPTLTRDIALLLATRRYCGRVVVQFHGTRSNWLVGPERAPFKALTKWLVSMADLVLLLSTEERDEWLVFEPRARYAVVLNCLVPAVSERGPEAKSTAGHSGAAVILFVGRIRQDKGVFDLLKAFQGVCREEAAQLVLAGDGPASFEFSDRAKRLGLDSSIELLGFVEPECLPELYRAADLFVLPSYAEGFPTVLAEAMHAGLPIVTTGIRGAADQLVDGENALFVEPGHPEQIEAALLRLLRDPGLRGRMASANQERVGRFAPEPVAAEYARLLEELF